MKPVGPFFDDFAPRRPAPEITELTNVAHPTFGLLLSKNLPERGNLEFKKYLTPRAREAYQWLKENAVGLYRVEISIGSYLRVQIQNERDAILFKTYWL